MREIKFRARLDKKAFPRSYNKGWAYGFVSRNDDGWAIDTFGNVGGFVGNGQYLSIDGETIGQYTGLKDKNGTEIFHKDIVDWIDGEFSFRAVVEDGYWQWYLKGVYPIDNFDFADYTDKNQTDLVIVGNIYENPELLEVTE